MTLRKALESSRERILALHAAGERDGVAAELERLHPADIAELLVAVPDALQMELVGILEPQRIAAVMGEMDYDDQARILARLGRERAAAVLEEMSNDDIADLVGQIPPGPAREILALLEAEEAGDVGELLEYEEDTAGGIMTTEYAALREDMTADGAIDALRRLAGEVETIYYAYVTDAGGVLTGVLSFRDLLLAAPDTPVREIMNTNVIAVGAGDDQETVARAVARYDLLAIPVVDEERRLLGIVTVDDVVDVLEEEATEDFYLLASHTGARENEYDLGLWSRARKRLPWLVLLLFGELVAGNVISGFSGIIGVVTILAAFIPVMAGEAGNAATQSLAVVVRGLATGDIVPGQVWRIVLKEVKVGVVLGSVIGLVLAVVANYLHRSPLLGLVTGLALGLNITVATALGGFFPILIKRLGIDPAVASGPFITTLTDILSMVIYFTLAGAVFSP